MLVERAPAKVNLFLHITGRRENGYHDIESLVSFTDGLCDVLTAKFSDDPLSLKVIGPFADALEPENNLILEAAKKFSEAFGVNIGGHITLEKNIPVAAGLGGGSADAAAFLRMLMQHFDINDKVAINEIALSLGADVPMCLMSTTCIATGLGEVLAPLPSWPPLPTLLVTPNKIVSTADVFKRFSTPFLTPFVNPPPPPQDFHGYIEWLWVRTNMLTQAACQACPDIKTVLQHLAELEGCTLIRMSGSGATCFAIFETDHHALAAQKQIQSAHPDWWSQHVTLNVDV